MSSSSRLSDLLARKAALDEEIAHAQQTEKESALAQVRALMAQHGLTLADLGRPPRPDTPEVESQAGDAVETPRRRKAAGSGAKLPAKFRDASTGESWSGRGLKPRWMQAALAAGRSMDEFAL